MITTLRVVYKYAISHNIPDEYTYVYNYWQCTYKPLFRGSRSICENL